MKTQFIAWLSIVVLSMVARAGEPIGLDDATGPQSWGAADNVMRVEHLYFSAQPDEETLRTAKANGVDVVVNLRLPEEQEWDEQAAVERLGLLYYNVPIARSSETLSQESLERIETIVRAHRDQQILLHCSTGNRASAWFATHLVDAHDMATDDAIRVARKTGLTNAGMETRVRTYLRERETGRTIDPASGQN